MLFEFIGVGEGAPAFLSSGASAAHYMCGGGRQQIPRQWSCQVWKGGMLAHKTMVLPVWLPSKCEVRLQWEETAAPNKVEDRQGKTITQDSGVTLGC